MTVHSLFNPINKNMSIAKWLKERTHNLTTIRIKATSFSFKLTCAFAYHISLFMREGSGKRGEESGLCEFLDERRLIVCVGSGGVGKTTTSAALAIKAALMGKRSLVVTIDPAKRLANSLGLKEIGNSETKIPLEKFARGKKLSGSCYAMMLDTKSAFDELIKALSPTDETYHKIIENRIYQIMSDALAGSHEYVATEKLYDFYKNDKYDVIILDTPPMKNALDFLEATGRLGKFLDKRVLRWFLEPYQHSPVQGQYNPKALTGTGKIVFKMLSYVFGEEFLMELYEFFIGFVDMFEAIRIRTEEVGKLIRSNDALFLVITSPHIQVLSEARHFQKELAKRGLPFGGFIINQVNIVKGGEEISGKAIYDEIKRALGDSEKAMKISKEVESAYKNASMRANRDKKVIERLLGNINVEKILRQVPKLESDIHDIEGLLRLNAYLFGE
ncbi:MAG: ArsA family ATPase [Myxococcota bacterium]